MFPFDKSSELSFQVSNDLENTTSNSNISSDVNIYYDPSVVLEQNVSAPGTTHLHLQHQPTNHGKRGRPRKVPPSMEVNNINEDQGAIISGNDVTEKRIIHREIERQRRQEMTSHYNSLRSLLPLEYIKGKRSMCDHVTEATKYIKDMEKNINELRERKEKLKSSSSASSPRHNLRGDLGCSTSNTTNSSSSSSSSRSDYSVSIHTSTGAIEIEISAEVGEEDVFPLSKVLHVLIQEGLNVVDCVSSKVNQRWMYIIHCEVCDEVSIDSSQLQQRLMSEICS